MSEKKTKALDVTELVNDICCSNQKYTIEMVDTKVSKWLADKGKSKSKLGCEIYDLISMLYLCDFKPDTVESVIYEDEKYFVSENVVDFSLTLKDKSYWHIEVVEVHPMIQQAYEDFKAEICKKFKDEIFIDPIIISNNYNSYYKKPKGNILDNNTNPEAYNYNVMRLNFWQNYFECVQRYIKDAQSKLIDLCKEDAEKVRDYVVKSSNETIEQLDQIISYSNTESIFGIQQKLQNFLEAEHSHGIHPIISKTSNGSLKDYYEYIYQKIKDKFDKQYQLKNQKNTRNTLLVSVQICSHTDELHIKESAKECLLKKINCDLCSEKYKFFQEIYILDKTLIQLKRDGDSGVWSLSKN